ncbi:MAG: FHA domain-containing protein [Chloroflexi bacterium]|nr:FHA domain-containing protein [Chloroflexota bacterium]
MFPEFTQGTFLWNWFNSYAGVHAMAISLIVAILAVGMTKWSPYRGFVKIAIMAGAVATIPLGLDKMGVNLVTALDIPMANDQVATYLSFFGSVLAVSVGVPFLFREVFRASSGKVTEYLGKTNVYQQPQPAAATPAAGNMGGNTMDFQTGPRMGQTVDMGQKTLNIGRSPDNDIVVDDPTVSRHHARVTFDGNQYLIEDLSSTAGTMINGQKVGRGAVPGGATVKLGDTEIVFNRNANRPEPRHAPAQAPVADKQNSTKVFKKQQTASWLAVTEGPDTGGTLQLSAGDNFIGRGQDNEFVLGDSYVSSRHAMVRVQDGKSYVYDVGSRGGTVVNGKRVGGHRINPDSMIRLGETLLCPVSVDQVEQANPGNGETMIDRHGQSSMVLVARTGPDSGRSFNLSEGYNHIGRDPSSGVRLSDESVSRHHAVIRCEDGAITLFDVGSRSGTEVDGKSVGGHLVNDQDTISVGRTTIRLMAPTS